MEKVEPECSTGCNWSDCTPVWDNSWAPKMFQRESFLQKRPRKTKLTQNCRAPQVLTDNKMDNKRCWSVVLTWVEVQNPGQVSTCKCTPISRRKITTKQYTPHPYLRRYHHVLTVRMFRENHLPSGENRSSVGKETVKRRRSNNDWENRDNGKRLGSRIALFLKFPVYYPPS